MPALQELDIDRYRNLTDLLEQHWQGFASHPAFANLGCSLTFRQVDRLSRHFSAYLQHCTSLQPGDRIGVLMPNLLQYPVVVYAAWRAGLVVVNLNPLSSVEALRHRLQDAEVRAVVVLANCARQLETVLSDTQVKHVVVTELGDLHPWYRRYKINLMARYLRKIVPVYRIAQSVSFRRALDRGSRKSSSVSPATPEQPALIQYTSGSRHNPWGVVLTHRNLIANTLQIKQRLSGHLKIGDEIVIAPLPLYHIYGFSLYTLLLPVCAAQCVLITNPKDTRGMVNELGRWKFTAFTGLNSLFVSLCQNSQFRQLDFRYLKLTVSGGMALMQSVAEQWQQVTGNRIIQGYGLTEASPVVAVAEPGLNAIDSVGQPLDLTEVRIVDEQGQVLDKGETGELYVRGPQVTTDYWGKARDVNTTAGWLATGDIVRCCADGALKIVGRKQDILNISGFPVHPQELENIISSHPDILECAVIGLPDDAAGEVIKLFVVSLSRRLTVKQVREYCRERLTSYKVPKLVEFCSVLPKSDVGKVQHQRLRADAIRKSQRQRRHL